MNKAIILDRDGTINVEKNYLYKIEDFEFTYKAKEAIKLLKDNGYLVIVISNQAGVARGYYDESDVNLLHKWINEELKVVNTQIDEFLYCPHHPNNGEKRYRIKCKCRKPGTLLYEMAINKYNIDVSNSYVIGDKITDLIPGNKLGFSSILVRTGYGKTEENRGFSYGKICNNLYEASLLIKEDGIKVGYVNE